MEGTSECMNEEREMGLRGWERVRRTPRACPCVSRVLVALEKRLLTGDRTGEGEGERECLCDCERVCV